MPGRKRNRRASWSPDSKFVQASDVRIIRPDGSVEIERALDRKELAALTKERRPLAETEKARILRRDRSLCRYCGCGITTSTVEFDHVVPVALGGVTSIGNIVSACADCNRRKGARIWKPRPIR